MEKLHKLQQCLAQEVAFVTITDSLGCTKTECVKVPGIDAIDFALSSIDVRCNGANNGSINLTVISGGPATSYLWNDGTTTQNRVATGRRNLHSNCQQWNVLIYTKHYSK